ncbi:MAG: hypothetical protein Q9159_002175 [Coniocarpon cinnabarinum]
MDIATSSRGRLATWTPRPQVTVMLSIFSAERLPYDELELSDDSDSSELCANSDRPVEYESKARLQTCHEGIAHLIRLVRYIKPQQDQISSDKARRYRPIDPDTNVDLLHQYYLFDERHIKELFRCPSPHQADSPLTGGYLVPRLAEASTRRRQQLMYWKHHQDKLRRATNHEQPSSSSVQPASTEAQDQLQTAPQSSDNHESHSRPSVITSNPTTATAVQDVAIDREDVRSNYSSASGTSSMVSSISDFTFQSDGIEQFDMPAAPRSLLTGTHFECPICFLLLDQRYLKEQAWSTRNEWADHEAIIHRPAWRCSEHSFICSSTEEIKDHYRQLHNVDSQQGLDGVALATFTTFNDNGRPCPLCSAPLMNFKKPTKHIAGHLERLAAIALTCADINEDENARGSIESEVASRGANAGSSEASRQSLDNLEPDDDMAHSDSIDSPKDGEDGRSDANADLSTMFMSALRRGEMFFVDTLLDKGADVNARDRHGETGLYAASAFGDTSMVRLLLERGADVNAQGGQCGNALHAASREGYKEIVQILVDHGADVNAQSGHYSNTLPADGSNEYTQALLEHGVDVTAQGGHHGTALQAASRNGHKEVVQILLDNGAHVGTQQDGPNSFALEAASIAGHKEIVEILLDRDTTVNPGENRDYRTALEAASMGGHADIVQTLLDHGADVSGPRRSPHSSNPLELAAAGGHREAVRLLLDRGADVNARGGAYSSALAAASAEGHEEIELMLLENAIGLGKIIGLDPTYSNTRRLFNTEQIYLRLLSSSERLRGPNHISTFTSLCHLGDLYKDQGKQSEAEESYDRALDISEKIHGIDHSRTLDIVGKLSVLYKDQGKLAKAEASYQRALAMSEKTYGTVHTSTFNIVRKLGVLYRDQGKFEEAEAAYQRALALSEKIYGPDDPWTFARVEQLIVLYKNQGRFEEADKLYQRAQGGRLSKKKSFY